MGLRKITFILIAFYVFPNPIYAYMDPGTWSYFISFILAFIAGAMFYIKLIWTKIRQFFEKLFNND